MEAHIVLATGFEQVIGTHDIGLDEGLGVGDGVVVVRFGRIVHDSVVAGNDAVEKLGIADIAHDELYAVLGKARDVGGITRIGELVENGHVHIRMVVHHVVHEVRTYEPTAARDDNVGGRE